MPLEDVLGALSTQRTWAMIEEITSEIPSRLAGSENSRRMAEYSRDRFAEAGLECTAPRVPRFGLIPGSRGGEAACP